MRTSDELDPDLAELLRRAADRIPGYRSDLATVVRRRRAGRYRQVLGAGLAAGVAAAVLVTGAALMRPGSRPDSRPAPPPFPSVVGGPSAQRLFITPAGQSWGGTNGKTVGLGGNEDLGEVLPNGELTMHKVPGLSAVAVAVALPDGGVAALGVPAATPGAAGTPSQSPTDGTGQASLTLAVLRPDGSLRLLRDRVGLGLVGADEKQVYVYGAGSDVSAVDLTTGQQRTMPWGGEVPVAVGSGHAIDLIGDPPGPAADTCWVRVLDTATGDRLSDNPVPAEDCGRYGGSLSPDGRRLAIVRSTPYHADTNQLLVVVIDVTTGKQLTQRLVDESPFGANGGDLVYGGVCWSDPDHVWVSWFHLPVPAVRMYSKAETLRQAVVPVPGS